MKEETFIEMITRLEEEEGRKVMEELWLKVLFIDKHDERLGINNAETKSIYKTIDRGNS